MYREEPRSGTQVLVTVIKRNNLEGTLRQKECRKDAGILGNR